MAAGEDSFDVVIIGGGPGGYVAAIRAAQLGLNAACVEEDKLGGVCLNIGCIPTKALLTSAFLVNEMKDGEKHGIIAPDTTFDLGPAQKRSRAVADQLSNGVAFLFKKNKVTHVQGRGRLAGKGKVEVTAEDGSTRTLSAQSVVIATGSHPRSLSGLLEIDEDRIWSSTGALFQTAAPKSLVVVGAGAVGVEFADIYNAYGTDVTILEAADRILPIEDKDSSQAVTRSFKKRKITVNTGARLQKAEAKGDHVSVVFQDSSGAEQTIEAEYVLAAVGRVPRTDDIGLDSVGVELDDHGFVKVDSALRTNVPGVYAIGDCAGHQLLAHKAMHEGVVCAEQIAGHAGESVDYDNVPNCTYCHPEVASIGLTEAQARDAGYDIEVGKFPWVGNGRALASGHAEGFVKVIRDKQYSEILGAHIVGPHATELIAEFVVGRHLESTVEEIDKAMHPHPTLSEAVAEGALAALGRPLHI